MRIPRTMCVAVLMLSLPAAARAQQVVAPRWSARVEAPAAAAPLTLVDSAARARFRPERILAGAAIGAVVGGVVSYVLSTGACEAQVCNAGRDGLSGALVGGAVGGLFGLLAALPPVRQGAAVLDYHVRYLTSR